MFKFAQEEEQLLLESGSAAATPTGATAVHRDEGPEDKRKIEI